MDTDERVGLVIAAVTVLAVLLLAAWIGRAPTSSGCPLPVAVPPHSTVDATLVVTLPDSGGIVVNGQSVERQVLLRLIPEFFQSLAPDARATFAWAPSRDRCAELRWIEEAVRAAGGRLYDAERSGWPRPMDARE